MADHRKIFILGLDGATFDLIDLWIDRGILPNLKKLKNSGSWGELESTNPPTTPPAWTSAITGMDPGYHGIFDFTVSPLQNAKRPLVSSSTVHGNKIWHILNAFDQKTIVLNVPITYPPESVNGIMISGMMTPSFESSFTFPENIKTRLKAVCGNYIPNVDIPKYDVDFEPDAFAFLDDIRECFERRREAVRHLMATEDWDFFMVVFIAMDRIQHLFYKYLVPDNPLYETRLGERLRTRIIEEYKRIDDAIGEITNSLDANTIRITISDHGFGPTRGYFNANKWLMDQGFLTVNPLQYAQKRAFHLAMQIGNSQWTRKVVPEHWLSTIRKKVRQRRSTFTSAKSDLMQVVDWPCTKAYFASIPTQGIFINEKRKDGSGLVEPGEDVRTLKNEIKSRLMQIHNPLTGNPIIDAVWFREEIYSGPNMQWAPHILFKMANYSVLGRQHIGADSWFSMTPDSPIGFHRSNGIFMIHGPNIQPGHIQGAKIIDIMPTALYASGNPMPECLDGKIISDAFQKDFLENHDPICFTEDSDLSSLHNADENPIPVTYREEYTQEEQDVVEKRLKSLGYLE